MKYALYIKGSRGLKVFEGLKENGLFPSVCIGEIHEDIIADLCALKKIPYFCENKPDKKEHMDFIHRYNIDLLVCAGYGKIIPTELFCNMRFGAINCHGGRLPEYRGASPIPWQIIQGESYGVAYVLKMTQGIDNGPIIAQERYDIEETDTAWHVTNKVDKIFQQLVPKIVKSYFDGCIPDAVPQQEKNACHWTRRYPSDGLIVWDRLSARQVVNLVRALNEPYPGAFFMQNGERIIVRRARVYAQKMAGIPGRFVGKSKAGALIHASDGVVEVLEFKKGNKIFSGMDFAARYGENF